MPAAMPPATALMGADAAELPRAGAEVAAVVLVGVWPVGGSRGGLGVGGSGLGLGGGDGRGLGGGRAVGLRGGSNGLGGSGDGLVLGASGNRLGLGGGSGEGGGLGEVATVSHGGPARSCLVSSTVAPFR